MFYEFLTPYDKDKFFGEVAFKPNQIGGTVVFYEKDKVDLNEFDIAIIGIQENRGHEKNKGVEDGQAVIRRELYNLYVPNVEKPFRVVDLGNMKLGAKLKDSYFGLATVMLHLLTHNVIPVILGGTHDNTFGQYLGYQELYTLINMVVVDEKIDLDDPEKHVDASSYILATRHISMTRMP